MKITKINSIILFCSFLFLFSLSFSLVSASWGLNEVVSDNEKLESAFGQEDIDRFDSGFYLSARASMIVGSVLSFVGVLFLALVIYGGFLWMTARGNQQQVEKAKNLIIQAVIGVVIVLSAYIITSFIGSEIN